LKPLVKICGITNLDDALCAVDAGANALGFIFYPKSPRFVAPETALEIIRKLPPFVTKVGVFAAERRQEISRVVTLTGITALQLSGNELPADCTGYDLPVIKAFRFRPGENVAAASRYKVSAYLIDGFKHGLYGGSGVLPDIDAALELKTHGRVILAGGLNPGNIAELVNQVHPYAVDVNSGVESEPGKKDPAKILALFNNLSHS
jgi:phosphoribosylanthranilate isomerase